MKSCILYSARAMMCFAFAVSVSAMASPASDAMELLDAYQKNVLDVEKEQGESNRSVKTPDVTIDLLIEQEYDGRGEMYYLGDVNDPSSALESFKDGSVDMDSMESVPDRALGSRGWYLVWYNANKMAVFYYNGSKYTVRDGSRGCYVYTTPYTVVLKIENEMINGYGTNMWAAPYTDGSYFYCGTSYHVLTGTTNNTLAPGKYNFVLEQSSYTSAWSYDVAACVKESKFSELYAARDPQATDFFMTTKWVEYDYAIGVGYVGANSVAKVVPESHGPNSALFRRFYKGAPETEHFYTAIADEATLVKALGWQEEGPEGYIYTRELKGTVPLHRLYKVYDSAGDLEHFYTISNDERISYIASGWVYDGVKGYVCKK